MQKLSDYTTEQIAQFEKMQLVLAELNQDLANGKEVMPLPYSRAEIGALSRYQQLVLAEKASKEYVE